MNIADWGLSEKGFYCPTYDEVLASKIKSAKELFGENICTDNNTALGKFIRLETAYDLKQFEEMEKIYYSISPVTATGVSLDRDVSFARMSRNTAIAAVHKIRIYGAVNHMLGKGTLVKSQGGIVFYTVADCVISEYDSNQNDIEMYYGEVNVQCAEAGTVGNVYDINSLVSVDNDVTAITYVSTVTNGADTESDIALLTRYNDVVDGMGTNTKSAIISGLMRINGVHKVIILDNPTNSNIKISDYLTVESGKYAIIIYANSGLDTKIAEAIFMRKPFGIKQNGTTTVNLKDESGETHAVVFSYVREIPENIEVTCTVSSEFSSNGIENIKANISEYVNNLDIGKPLIYSKLYQQIYSVPGTSEITKLTVNGATDSIYPARDEIIRVSNISVSITED